jgi:tetratricopeptide (TPR) repeat protein
MGKASRKKQSASEAGKPAGSEAHKLTSSVQSEASHIGKSAVRQSSLFHKPIVHLLLIAVLGFLVYSNTFHSPFQWDEADFIVGNPIVKDLAYFSNPSLAEGFPVYDGLAARYVGYLTFALNHKVNGLNVFGYHVANLAIHLINALLVYFFIFFTFKTPYFGKGQNAKSIEQSLESNKGLAALPYAQFVALAVALLFVAHPIQTEAVTYVFQRFASLVSMFYLLSLVLYVKGRLTSEQASKPASWKTGKPASYYFLALLSAVLAMKTKENAFTLPVIMTLYEFLFFTGPLKSRILRLAPFLLTMLIIPMTMIRLDSSAVEVMSQIKDPVGLGYEKLSRGDYLITQFPIIATYLRLLFFPANQNIDYDYPVYHSFFAPPVFLSLLLLLSLFGTAVYLLYRSRQEGKPASGQADNPVNRESVTLHALLATSPYSRLVAFGILWFFITLSVESSIIPIPMVINEYRTYLPSAGFFLAVVAGFVLFLAQISRFTTQGSRFAKVAFALFAVIILGLASATYARNALWKDKINLWQDVVGKSPNSPRGYNNLGIAYKDKGMQDEAIRMYERAIALRPSFRAAHVNLGVSYAMSGQTDRAIEELKLAITMDPKNYFAYTNLGRAYSQAGRPDLAVENYIKGIEHNPFNSSAYHGLGTAYMRLGKTDAAIAAYSKFAEVSPNNPEAYRNRGIAYATKSDFNSARADFQQACSMGSGESCGYLRDPQFR